MTSFLPPLSTATPPQNEIICPELRISGAYLPRTQNFRGWPAQKIPAAEFIPLQKSPKNCRGGWSDFVLNNRAKPHPYFSYTFRPLLYPLPGSTRAARLPARQPCARREWPGAGARCRGRRRPRQARGAQGAGPGAGGTGAGIVAGASRHAPCPGRGDRTMHGPRRGVAGPPGRCTEV